MGLRCLIGHDFGEVLTDRDREERGDEVVVSVQEYRECSRCGEVRVVAENTEVRHRDTATGSSTPAAESAPDEPPAAADYEGDGDDGIILEDEPEAPPGRARGAWPESDEPEEEEAPPDEEPEPWPEVDGEDEGYAAESGDDRPLEGVEFGSGLTPEAAADDPTQAQLDEEVIESEAADEGIRRATPGPAPTGRQRSTAAETEFFCPECEFTTPTEGSSLRPGDICPECRLGYLTERER